jgi:hypothetical protein
VRLVQTLLCLPEMATMSRGRGRRSRFLRRILAVLPVVLVASALSQSAAAQTGSAPRRPGAPEIEPDTPDFLFGRAVSLVESCSHAR